MDYSDIHEKLDALIRRNHELVEQVNRIEATINKADQTIATIAAEVKPTLDAAMNHPMAKMFGLGKK
jgi:predicted nuclease with TOPRIM domain